MRPLFALLLAAAAAPLAPAQSYPARLEVDPAAPAARPLRHALVYELRDTTPGDAAPLYDKAAKALATLSQSSAGQDLLDKLYQAQDQPPAALDRKAARALLAAFAEPLKLVEEGARREACDFGLAERYRKDGVYFDPGEIFRVAELARLLALRCRLEVAEGDLGAALRTVRSGLSLARHLSEQPGLGSFLPSHEIAHIMLNEVEVVVQQPGAPSLSHALTALPPLVNTRKALEGDRLALWASFPGMLDAARDPAGKPLAPADVELCVSQLEGLMDQGGYELVPGALRSPLLRLRLAQLLRRDHDAAKKALVAAGRPAAQVERMPHVQVALLHALEEFDRAWDEVLVLDRQPLPRAWPRVEALDGTLRTPPGVRPPGGGTVGYYVGQMAPNARDLWQLRLGLEARVAALRCVEAVRLHAAAHGGRPPARWKAVTAVEVPDDPGTGRPFLYTVKGRTVTLAADGAKGMWPAMPQPVQYEVTLRGR